MAGNRTILDRWSITSPELTDLLDGNPSLRGMLFGYVAELKLTQLWFSDKQIIYKSKHDDHDRKNKGDHVVSYKGEVFLVESKSLQTHSIRRDGRRWVGRAQVDASDRRTVTLPSGKKLNTTCLLRGEFDLLAVNCFAFEEKWRFVFAKNGDLPCSTWRGYTPTQRKCLLPSLITVTWPPEPPFFAEPYGLLDEIRRDRAAGRWPYRSFAETERFTKMRK